MKISAPLLAFLLSALPAMAATAPAPPPVVQAPHGTHATKPKGKPVKHQVKPTPPAADPMLAPAAAPPAPAAPAPPPPPDTAKPAPPPARFMSLRFDDVNMRVGPGTRYPIDWVYHRKDLPVEVLRELDDWRLVQDQDSIHGWVKASSLSPRRSFIVRGGERVLRSASEDAAAPVARLKEGVIGHLRACAATSAWCEAEVGTYRGWLRREEIFGVYPNEAIGG